MPDRFRGVRETRATGRLTLPDAVSEEAFRLVEEEGPEQLNLRRLAERMAAKGMKFSKTAPLHHFGSMTDFYAAVGRQGFDLMAERLRAMREKRPPTRGLVLREWRLATACSAWSARTSTGAMHWPSVWAGVAKLSLPDEAEEAGPAAAEMPWLIEVSDARDLVFVEFMIAVQLGQAAGALRTRWAARDAARVLTAVVDGDPFKDAGGAGGCPVRDPEGLPRAIHSDDDRRPRSATQTEAVLMSARRIPAAASSHPGDVRGTPHCPACASIALDPVRSRRRE